MKTKIILIAILAILVGKIDAKDYKLSSPNAKLELTVSVEEKLYITVANNGYKLLDKSPVDLIIDQKNLFQKASVSKIQKRSAENIIIPEVKVKTDQIKEKYNEFTISFKGGHALVMRAYDEGVAYRFKTNYNKEVIVNNEILNLNLPKATDGFLMQEKSFNSMSEWPYIPAKVENYKEKDLFSLPCLFKAPNGNFLLVTESDIEDYPGMWMQKQDGILQAALSQKVTKTQEGACYNEQTVTERADYLAQTKGKREYPWRVFIAVDNERELLTNQLVYLLGKPAPKGDYSWIKPGLATLDWWGRRNIFDTDFKGGVNGETQKYFVDFNNRYNIKYFVLDDGWSAPCDLRETNKDIDLDALKAYAEQKNVGLVYWAHTFALKQDVPGYLDFLKSKGASGIKIDFFNRDDQEAINLMHEIAREALKREIVIDFHGVCKPFGLIRTYPNVLTSEGLIEFEMNGVSDWANPIHHTMLPFIRMVAGPMDFLPGTFNNAQKSEFHMSGNRPVGQGSRAHAIAQVVLYESPITMIPDSPADYLLEDECTKFLTSIPVAWDDIKVVDAKFGEYIVLARRSGDDWFLAAITNWDKRTLNIQLDFLGEGSYKLDCIKDGVNTEARAIDYVREASSVSKKSVINMNLSTGGGWVGKLSK